jgi:hypothetical protein
MVEEAIQLLEHVVAVEEEYLKKTILIDLCH